MMNIGLKFFWTNSPMPVNQKLNHPDIVLNIPFGNILVIDSGSSSDAPVRSVNTKIGDVVLNAKDVGADPFGTAKAAQNQLAEEIAQVKKLVGNNQQHVYELDLTDYADKTPTVMHLTSDVMQHIEGTDIRGKVVAADMNSATALSCYFDACIGEIKFTLSEQSPIAMFAFKDQKPTQAMIFSNLTNELVVMAVMLGGYLQVILAENKLADFKLGTAIAYTESEATIGIKFLALDRLELFINDVSLGSYTHTQELGKYLQNVNYSEALKIQSINYDLSQAYGNLVFKVPSAGEDGTIYHLTTNAPLLGKQLYKDDYIQFYNNKTALIIYRLPEKIIIPPQINYFRNQFTSLSQLQSIKNPKSGDYAIYNNFGITQPYFYSDVEKTFKPYASAPNYRGRI